MPTRPRLRAAVVFAALCVTASAQLSGGYTVGTGGAYPDLGTAIAALNTQGVSAPVVFTVNGAQTGPWTINAFPGQGTANPVTFLGGGATSLGTAGTILTLAGCSDVTFDGFTATGSTAGMIVFSAGNPTRCVFRHCTFTLPVNTTGAGTVFLIQGGSFCRIEDSTFGGGYEAFNSNAGGTDLTIQRCRMQGGGFWICESGGANTTFQNNFVYGTSNYGFRASGGVNLKIYNNSFYIAHTISSAQYCCLRWYTLVYSEVVNNAFTEIGVAPAQSFLLWSLTGRPNVMDNNTYNETNNLAHVFFNANYTFAGWQALGSDLASVVGDPLYTNVAATPPDLHISPSSPCASAGATLATVTDDIDGAPRVPPYDIGAHEVTAFNLFTAVTTGNGTGDLTMTLTQMPVGATEGYVLVSAQTAGVVGTGSLLGIEPDGYTFIFLQEVMAPGDPLHFPIGIVGIWPDQPFVLPAGTLALGGQVWDAVVVTFGPGYQYLGRSAVQRLHW